MTSGYFSLRIFVSSTPSTTSIIIFSSVSTEKIVNSKIKLNDFNLEGTNLQCSLPSRVQVPIEFEFQTQIT